MTTSTDRQQFREVLSSLASRMQAKLPALNGRTEKACKLVLQGDVELHSDGTALVNSLTDPAVAYQVAPGLCQCKDYDRAPEHLCCHRLAAGFLRKLRELAPATTETIVSTLPEARASVNARVLLGAIEVQLTLRGDHEHEVINRLRAVIKEHDLRAIPKPARGNWKKPYQGH